jgi:hypothetical protein
MSRHNAQAKSKFNNGWDVGEALLVGERNKEPQPARTIQTELQRLLLTQILTWY